MTATVPRPRPGALRPVAEEVERTTGLQVEIIGGALVMSPTPRGKHAGVVYRLEEAIRPRLSKDLAAFEMASVEMPSDPDDYCTPDLTVGPTSFLDSDDWLLEAAEVELAVEVISKSEKGRQVAGKVAWYAESGVRRLLVIDPRDATWTLYTHPRAGDYQGTLNGSYGDAIPLPELLGFEIDTTGFPSYGK